jgi:hypothetical protein
MEITKFVVEGRDKAKLYGDSASYRGQLSNRIHNLRKKLGIATKPRAKYTNRPVTVEDIAKSHEYEHQFATRIDTYQTTDMSTSYCSSPNEPGQMRCP